MSMESKHVIKIFSSNDVNRAKWHISIHSYSLCIGSLMVEYYPPRVQTRVQFPTNTMTEMCEHNLREQTSSHRKLPIYGENGVNYIKAPNKHIKRVRTIFYMNNSLDHGHCR